MSDLQQTLAAFQQNFAPNADPAELLQATLDTLLMLGGSLALTLAIGLPLGVILYLTARGRLLAAPGLHAGLGLLVNILRAVPFVILLILLIPVTVALVGTSLGVQGAIVPLVIGTAPFFARLVEAALKEVDQGVIEASQAMGARPHQIVFGTLLPEALPGLLAAGTVTAVALISYTAMAGVVGAGGLGDMAIRYGYQRFQTDVMVITVVLMLILVQVIQTVGDRLVTRFSHR